jgi:hypothetical protein
MRISSATCRFAWAIGGVLMALTACAPTYHPPPALIAPLTLTPGPETPGTNVGAGQPPDMRPPTSTPVSTVTPFPTSTLLFSGGGTPPGAQTLAAMSGDGGPRIHYFVAAPSEAAPGDTLTLTWSVGGGSQVVIARLDEEGDPDETWEVDLHGTLKVEVVGEGESETYVITVGNGETTAEAELSVEVQAASTECELDWFFEPAPEKACPAREAETSEAAYQSFEGGHMVWVRESDLIYVFFEDGSDPAWANFTDTWQDGEPESDPGLSPPPGLGQPVRGFGKVWRNEPDVRPRLGWATASEQTYDITLQTAEESEEGVARYLTWPDGAVIELELGGEDWQVIR